MSTTLDPIVIRTATHADQDAIERLAERDSARAPRGTLLVGEIAGELRAAVSLDGSGVIADPFHSTADLLALLEARAGQLRSRRRATRIAARTPAPAPHAPATLRGRALA
jgi:hypothetical protein